MKSLLLDTCALLTWAQDPRNLNDQARILIANGRQRVFVSAASVWEIAIKTNIGKMTAPQDIPLLLSSNRFLELPITNAHALATSKLPVHHKDPFDRLLIAQTQVENLVLVTTDKKIAEYDIDVLAA